MLDMLLSLYLLLGPSCTGDQPAGNCLLNWTCHARLASTSASYIHSLGLQSQLQTRLQPMYCTVNEDLANAISIYYKFFQCLWQFTSKQHVSRRKVLQNAIICGRSPLLLSHYNHNTFSSTHFLILFFLHSCHREVPPNWWVQFHRHLLWCSSDVQQPQCALRRPSASLLGCHGSWWPESHTTWPELPWSWDNPCARRDTFRHTLEDVTCLPCCQYCHE